MSMRLCVVPLPFVHNHVIFKLFLSVNVHVAGNSCVCSRPMFILNKQVDLNGESASIIADERLFFLVLMTPATSQNR
jgi:hypothetical protein